MLFGRWFLRFAIAMLSFAWRGRIGQGRLWSTQGRHGGSDQTSDSACTTRCRHVMSLPILLFFVWAIRSRQDSSGRASVHCRHFARWRTDVRQFRARHLDRAPRHMKSSIGTCLTQGNEPWPPKLCYWISGQRMTALDMLPFSTF